MTDTDFEDDSEFEEYSPKRSFDSDDSRRRSQTTISSYEEAATPSSGHSRQRPFEVMIKPVEGPRGPHLFRSSQASAEFMFDYAMQMSPLTPKNPPARTETAFSRETVTPVTQQRQFEHSIAHALQAEPAGEDAEAEIRRWNPTQVIDWMLDTGVDPSTIECFELHDIDGAVLLDLLFDDLKDLGIQSFGKRHHLWNAICNLRGEGDRASPQPTPFQDISRPCTAPPMQSQSRTQRSLSRRRSQNRDACETPNDGDATPISPSGGKKRRGRKNPKTLDVVTPAESVSIVAIEQLLPKPHKCAKGERCAKWRQQQRQLQQLHDEHGLGRFPISPKKGGRIFVAGDPGNAATAQNIVPNVLQQPVQSPFRPNSEAVPSVVASSDLLGPGQLSEFALHEDMLQQLQSRDPQDNVRQFLNFQHLQSPSPPVEQSPIMSPPTPMERSHTTPPELSRRPLQRSSTDPSEPPSAPTLDLFPAEYVPVFPAQLPRQMPGPHEQLRSLPKLAIPRSATAQPHINTLRSPSPATATSVCRSLTASPAQVYRLGTPASEMDVPVTAVTLGPISRDASQSVPPNMQYRDPQPLTRSKPRAAHHDWRRPSFALPAVKEGQVLSPSTATSSQRPSLSSHTSTSSSSTNSSLSIDVNAAKYAKDPSHHTPRVQNFGYGADCTLAGWMKKRKTKMLRHEWQEAHFRLTGTSLSMHENARLSSAPKDTINVDNYAVACSTVASSNKLTAAFKALAVKEQKRLDPAAFAFQLVPASDAEHKKAAAGGKTHHFAVKTTDERIDWMRELMLAKAVQEKGRGYDVEVNGVQA